MPPPQLTVQPVQGLHSPQAPFPVRRQGEQLVLIWHKSHTPIPFLGLYPALLSLLLLKKP